MRHGSKRYAWSRCRFVGDVKYKRIRADGVLHPDLYQLLAYTIAADLPAGLLIYAAGEDEPVVHQIVNIGKRLEVVTLDLAGTPDVVLAQVGEVAGWVRRSRVHDRIPHDLDRPLDVGA